MSALELLPDIEARRRHALQPVTEPLRPVPELVPERATEAVAKVESPADVAARARATAGLQQQIGNARIGELVPKEEAEEAPPPAEAKAEEPPAKKETKEEKEQPAAAKAPEKKGEEAAPKKGEAETKEKAAPPSPKKAIGPAVAGVKDRAKKARKHSEPGGLVGSAQAAAKVPKTEQTRDAAVATVGQLDEAKAEKVRRDEFKAKLKKALDDATPKPTTESEADRLRATGAKNTSAVLQGSLATERDAAAGQIKGATATEVPPESQAAPVKTEMKTETVGAPPAPVSADPVVPAPLPPEQLDYSSDRASTDTAMADAGVSTEQLAKGNEPQFNKTLSERSTAEKHEAAAEANYRKSEAGIHAQTEKAAAGILGKGLGGIHDERQLQLGNVTRQQNETKSKDAQERERVTTTINGIKEATRKDVGKILELMESGASKIFEIGLARAEKRYDDAFEEAKGGVGTWLTTWGDDWTEHIESALATGRQAYLDEVGRAIDQVADLVDTQLAAAKERVAAGRKEVENFVAGLDGSVKSFGEEALKEVSADFDAMGTEIDERRDALIDKLAQQYKASYERMSAREEELRNANKSLWQRVYDATVGVIKKILAFKDMLLGVLAKAASVVLDILSDPIGFLGNLVSAVMRGLENFMGRIGEHLQKGLMEWLFGALAGAGLQLPEHFDLKGILSIVLQVLGLTYANFRARAVAIVGEPIVAALEETAEIFKAVMTEGPSALWRFIEEKVQDLKSMVMDAIFDFIKEKVIIAGITWIIGLLNPASAFFKACKAIYDIVLFFINRGSQILALVNAVIDSIAAIAKGSLDAAAKKVEDALAKAIPVAIGFLAALLGLGDISGTVKKTIDKAQGPVNKAIDWAIHGAVKLVKAVGKGISGLVGKKEAPAARKKEEPPVTESGQPGHIGIAEEVGAKLNAITLPPDNDEAEKVIDREGNKLETEYAKRLEPGVKLTVNLVQPPPDKQDEEVDFDVIIAPNTAKLRFRRHTAGHDPAEAGTYDALTSKESAKTSGNPAREAHHAPPVALAVSLGGALKEAGRDMRKPSSDNYDPAKAGVLITAGEELEAKSAAHGPELSAVLVHENTHKHHGNDITKSPRIHGSEIRKYLGRYLRGRKADDVATTTTDQTVVNPGQAAFGRQIEKVAKNVTGEDDLTAALREEAPEIVTRVYEAESARSIGAVEQALARSEVDGPATARQKAIAKLKTTARKSWGAMIKLVKF